MVLLLVPPKINNIDRDTGADQLAPPAGLAYIASYLKNKGINVKVIDAQAEKLDIKSFKEKIRETAPLVVGITVHCSVQITEAHLTAKLVKEISSNIKVVIGGSHPSALARETLEQCSYIDIVVYGEGEVTMYETAENIKNNLPLNNIKGIAYRHNDKILINPPRDFIDDLDSLDFPAFELFPLNRYKPYFRSGSRCLELPVTTIRGCPSKCFFCYQPMSDNIRMRSPENIIKEIKYHIENFNLKQVLFTDDTFTLYPDRINKLCELLIKERLYEKINWLCASRVDIVNEELLKIMKKAGCYCITYGVESGSQYILDKIKKNISLAQAKEAVRLTKKHGIKADVNFIIGLPYETEKTIMQTIKFMNELDPDYVNIALLSIFPGTSAYEMARLNTGGLKLLNSDWNKSGRIVGNMVELEEIPRTTLEFYQMKAYSSFYLRPSKILNLLKKIDIKILLHYILHQLYSRFIR